MVCPHCKKRIRKQKPTHLLSSRRGLTECGYNVEFNSVTTTDDRTLANCHYCLKALRERTRERAPIRVINASPL